MKIVKQSEVVKQTVEMEGVKGVQRQLMIGSKDGALNFSFRIFTIHGNGHTPYHTHEFEHVNYALKGKGYIVDADGNENEFNEGDFAIIPPNEKHQFRNASKFKKFAMICAVTKDYE